MTITFRPGSICLAVLYTWSPGSSGNWRSRNIRSNFCFRRLLIASLAVPTTTRLNPIFFKKVLNNLECRDRRQPPEQSAGPVCPRGECLDPEKISLFSTARQFEWRESVLVERGNKPWAEESVNTRLFPLRSEDYD